MLTSRSIRRPLGILFLFSLLALVGACGGDTEAGGIRLASAETAAEIFENQPDGLIVLDVRTPEEFEAGHLDGATLIDFYEADFADRIADLDRDAPYLMYCRSGNRSGQAAELMQELGFTDVTDVDGGIGAWVSGGNPVVN